MPRITQRPARTLGSPNSRPSPALPPALPLHVLPTPPHACHQHMIRNPLRPTIAAPRGVGNCACKWWASPHPGLYAGTGISKSAAPWHSALQERKKLAAPAPSGSARPLFRTAAAAAFSVAASACCLDQPAWCGQVWLMISEACTWPPGARHPAEGTGLLPGQRRPHAHATLPVLQRGAASPLLGMVLSLEPRPTRRVCGVFALMDPLSTTATPGL